VRPTCELWRSWDSDCATEWEPDLRHVRGAGAEHIMELFLRNYLE